MDATRQKPSKFEDLPLSTSGPIDCALTGAALLNTPYLNKGSAFPADERRQFNLVGLLPQNVQTLDTQVKRAHDQYLSRHDDLAKNTFLASLKEQNEVLYYKVCSISPLSDLAIVNPSKLMPISYCKTT